MNGDIMPSKDPESLIPYEYDMARIKATLNNFKDLDGLDEVIIQLIEFKDSGIYDVLFNRQTSDDIYKSLKLGGKLSKEIILGLDLIGKANKTLHDPYLYPFFKKDLINFPDFYFLYKFLELSYFLSSLRKLNEEDLEKLYFCGIDELIIHNLDNFDQTDNFEPITDEFFFKLNNIQWESDESKTFFLKLNNVRTDIFYNSGSFADGEVFSSRDSPTTQGLYAPSRMIPTFSPLNKVSLLFNFTRGGSRSVYPINPFNLFFTPYENPYLNFPATENSFLLFLAGCSAVNDSRNTINERDVIMAYKTYFNLLKVDLVSLVDKLWNEKSRNENNAYMVCDNCGGYYGLEEGESTEDFSQICECGGKLTYSDHIK